LLKLDLRATEYMEGVEPVPAAPNGMVVAGGNPEKSHRISDKVDSKDMEMAEHV